MTTSRAESQHAQYGRRRSNTGSSMLRSPAPILPLKVGDSKVFNSWVHDPKESQAVIFNRSWWPGVVEGDMLRITCSGTDDSGVLFIIPKDEGYAKPQLQVRGLLLSNLKFMNILHRFRFRDRLQMHATLGITVRLS
jgi:DEP domain-containing protein 5